MVNWLNGLPSNMMALIASSCGGPGPDLRRSALSGRHDWGRADPVRQARNARGTNEMIKTAVCFTFRAIVLIGGSGTTQVPPRGNLPGDG